MSERHREKPLEGLSFALVGPGKVGTSLARWLIGRGARLVAVARRPAAPVPTLPRWARAAGALATSVEALESAGLDLLLVAVPDPALPGVVAALAARPQARVALHTSGPLAAEVLAPLRGGGSHVGGLHPLRAFPHPLPASMARRTFLALQGDAAAIAAGARIAEALAAPSAVVPAAARPLYHLAASLTAGGVVTLLAAAVELHRIAGLPVATAAGLRELALGALAEASAERPAAALTGPVARGDLRVLAQLDELRNALPSLHPLTVLLALETLRQVGDEGPASTHAELARALRALVADPALLAPLRADSQVLSSRIQPG